MAIRKPARIRDDIRRKNRLQRSARAMFFETLENRELLTGVHPIYAPGTPPERMLPDSFDSSASGNAFRASVRWSATATDGFGLQQGDPTTLTWSIVQDGLSIPGTSEPTANSNLVAFLDGIYPGGSGPDLTQRPWFNVMSQVFDNWSTLTGINYVYVPYDDGAAFGITAGALNARADVRVGGHPIDGNFGVLAYNYYPDSGDMVIDTADAFYNNTSGNSLGLRNVLGHEAGHGLGLDHVCPVNQTKLMEPFVSFAFDGPQHDDLLGVNRLYGDRIEPNDSALVAYDLGTVTTNAVSLDNVSIDGTSDTDYYMFTTTAASRASVLLRPTGETYLEGLAIGSACTSGAPFDSKSLNNLSVEILDTNGATVLAVANLQPAGVNELLTNVNLPAAGTYFIRVTGGTDQVQMYGLDLSLAGSAASGPVLIGIQPNDIGLFDVDNPFDTSIPANNTLTESPQQLTFRFDAASSIDATTLAGIQITRTGFDDRFDTAWASTDLATAGSAAIIDFTAVKLGALENNLQLVFNKADLGANRLPTIVVGGQTITVTLNTNATTPTTALQLVDALTTNTESRLLVKTQLRAGSTGSAIVTNVTNGQIVQLGGAGAPVASTNLGAAFPLELRLTALNAAANQPINVGIFKGTAPAGVPIAAAAAGAPTVYVDRQRIYVLVANAGTTTAQQIATAINNDAKAKLLVNATVPFGVATTDVMPTLPAQTVKVLAKDVVVNPGFKGLGTTSREVITRFAETLPDDIYRVEVYGIDSAAAGQVALKNTLGQLFQPTYAGLGQEISEFELKLGAQITAVVPQPVTRTTGPGGAFAGISQARNQIEVYFNEDDLKDDLTSAENPNFYQLIFTKDTVRNTDDAKYTPSTVSYDPLANKAILTFATNLDLLGSGPGTFRLRVGTNENPTPAAPVTVVRAGDVGSNFAAADTTAITISALNVTSTIVQSSISASAPTYTLDYPGAEDEPGHRQIPIESHFSQGADGTGIRIQAYNFKDVYGTDPFGATLHNQITEEQKQRARQVLDLFSRYSGIRFFETASSGMTIVTGDLRALDPTIPTGPGGVIGLASSPGFLAIMDGTEVWDNEFGGNWFETAMHELGHNLGLGHTYDLPDAVQGSLSGVAAYNLPQEAVFPLENDIKHLQYLYRPEVRDVDLYQFVVPAGTSGELSIETFADRLPLKTSANGILDTSIRLYRQLPNGTQELIGQNDDYYGDDSFLTVEGLSAGTYFIGVTAKGTSYDPTVPNSGLGGQSTGDYELRVNFRPAATTSIVDLQGQAFDGDADGTAGGTYNYWFRAQTAANTLFVDKSAPNGGMGTTAMPFNNLTSALGAAAPGQIVRVIGNPGVDNNLASLADNQAYEIGSGPLSDGATMVVPKGVTVMVDAGAIFKMQGSRIGVGSTTTAADRSGGALQVLGTPDQSVVFTSYNDESIGVDTNSLPTTPAKGDWGGLDFREDVDRGQGRFTWDRQGIFLNYVNHADMRYGGGRVVVDSVTQTVRPIDMSGARVTATFNAIQLSGDSAMGATPDTFEETNFNSPRYQSSGQFTPDYDRVGPEIHGNRLTNNSYNGLFVAIKTPAGNSLVPLTVAARFDDTDIVHMIADNLTVRGQAAGPYQEEVGPAVNLVTLAAQVGGGLAAGAYTYRIVNVDANGNEGVASVATAAVNVAAGGRVLLGQLPPATGDFVGRRLYRSSDTVNYLLVAEIDKSSTAYTDSITAGSGALLSTSTHLRPRPDARLAIDPGLVIKAESGRIEVIDGGNLIAEGNEGRDVIFTTRADDRYGGSGTFDTNNDDSAGATEIQPGKGNWGGLFVGPLSTASLDHVLVTFAGGVNGVEGEFAGFNPVEIHQADVRIANSVFESNANGTGGTAPANRYGRGSNGAATIFVRGAQPVIANNILRNNDGSAISINANALNENQVADLGRQIYPAEQIVDHRDNQGPYVRGNRLQGNGVNGLTVRGELLNTTSVWDDTDIVHVLTSQILVPDFHTDGGLLLHSSTTESLVVKLQGAAAGFVASGRPFNIDDRIGGTVQIVGQPGFPVILTSLKDDSVGAGFQPDGKPQVDTNGGAGVPAAGDWNSVKFDAFSNDRNVALVLERESPDVVAPGINSTSDSAQYLGILAPDVKSSDENLRLGFEVHGVISQPGDVDVYSFNGTAGTEVWLDIDRTSIPLNSVVELLDADGNVLARSDDSHTEKAGGSLNFVSDPVTVKAFPQPKAPAAFGPRDSQGGLSKDTFTQNPFDAGFRVTLPGTAGEQGVFHVRVRSSSATLSNVFGGLTSGIYQLQVRLSETDEFPGSTVQFADLRYATNGIELIGVPYHSPLLAEARESSGDNAGPGGAQNLGNILNSDRAAISVAGNISVQSDQDFYRFKVAYDGIQGTQEGPGKSTYVSAIFDLDYSDGLARGNTSMWIFDPQGRLVAIGKDSNIADDQPGPLQGLDSDDLGRSSAGKLDPFIGPINLPTTAADEYYSVAVTSDARIPNQMDQFLVANPTNPLVRLEPVNSVDRIAEQHFGNAGGTAPATANAVQVPVLFDTATGPVPYHLGDVVLFVSRGTPIGGGNGTGIATVDPFTGSVETSVGNFAAFSGDIALRRSEGNVNASDFGNIFTLSNGFSGNVTDATSGNLLQIDPGTAATTTIGDDGITTYRDDPGTAAVDDQGINVGVQFQAMTFTGNSGTSLFAVGSRGQNNWGGTVTNIVYQFDAQSGAAVSAPGGNRNTGQNPTQVLLPNSAGTQIRELGQITGVGGATVTGLASVGGSFYITTSTGGIYSVDGTLTATLVVNVGEPLAGLSVGPQTVEANAYASTLFAIATDGTIYAYSTLGVPSPIFVDNATSVETGISNVTGLAFSNLDRNLWHSTGDRATDAGHGIRNPLDDTRITGDGSNSLYFGSNGAATGTADNKYNFPGGAHGTIVSNAFSLKGYAASDQPTLYFSYFLATEPDDQDYSPGARTQPDAFRVYVAGDDGNWSLLGTNNSYQSSGTGDDERDFGVGNGSCSFPDAATQPCVQELFQNSGSWRQARISLGLFAGQENLRLRFEFATAGSLSVGNINTTGTEVRTVSADKLRDGQTITMSNPTTPLNPTTTFEVDLGPTLVVPTGAQFDGGGTFTITGLGLPQVFTFSAAATAGNNIQVNTSRTPAAIATDLAARINAFTGTTNVQAVVTSGNRVNLFRASGAALTVSAVAGMPVGFVEGASGVTGTNTRLVINAGMTATQVAGVLRTAMATVYAGGNVNSIKTYQDLVRVINHSVTGQVLTAGATGFGVESSLAGDGFGEGDESSRTVIGSAGLSTGSFPSRRGVDNNREGVYVDDIIIGFAERGEMVTGAQPDNTGFRDNIELLNNNLPATHTQTLVGEYQLEMRRSSEFWATPMFPPPARIVSDGIDTNGRATQQITVLANNGTQIFDGQTFVLSDGVDTLTFEFEDLDLPALDAQKGVTQGRVQVGFRPSMTNDGVAEAIRDAINSAAVQGILNFTAGLSDGVNSGASSTSASVHLYGPAVANTQGGTSSASVGLTTQVHNYFGDVNRTRQQGQVLIYSNLIRDAAQFGIVVDNGPRDRADLGGTPGVLPHPGAPINFDDLNSDRLAPGAVLMNNVLVRGGAGGIRISGDNTAGLDAAVPFVRAVNNTIYGRRQGDTGILVDEFASPTLLNNIVANLTTGIRILTDASTSTSVVGGTIYQNNTTNATTPGAIATGSFPIVLAAGAPLFVNAGLDNYYLAALSQAIDSSLGSFQDRSDFQTRVKEPLGIAPSPIIAPDHDITGQLRYNDPDVTTPQGQGDNVNIDRGAYDRNDYSGPFAELVVPRDNDSEGRDIDQTVTVVQLNSGVYASFDIVLKDGPGSDTPVEGTGIDQTTVNVNNITVARDGILLRANIDYLIGFQAGSNLLRITPLSGVWRNDVAYVITLSGIRDLAGNLLQANQADGSTRFTILMPGVELDYGDHLDDASHLFPTLFLNNGARHTLYDNDTTIYLGRLVDQDNNNGQTSATATGDDANSTAAFPSIFTLDATGSGGRLTWASLTSTLTVGGAGVNDGDTFTVSDRGFTTTFLFDSDGSTSVSATPPAVPTVVIPFNTGDTPATIATKIVSAIGRARITDLTTGEGLSLHSSSAGAVVTLSGNNDEDAIRFGGNLRIPFNPGTTSTPFDLLVSGAPTTTGGFLDAWFDWNADGDWADPGEQVFKNRPVDVGLNNLSIVTPASAAAAPTGTDIRARFRLSLTGGLTPNNISVGGEVEDYIVTVFGGSAPVPNPGIATDSYRLMEDGSLTTTDPLGTITVGVSNDNGVLANDTDADGDALQVILLDTPDYAQSFTLNPNGTFTYTPLANFNGTDTFSYLIRDNSAGALVSNTFGVATITVWEVNDPPVARDDQPTGTVLTTPEDPAGPGFYTFNSNDLVVNDWTPFGASAPHPYVPPLGTVDTEQTQILQVSGVGATNTSTTMTTLQGGTITLNSVGGTLTYQPPLNFNDTSGANTNIFDSFVYFVVDNGTTDGVADPKYSDNAQNPVGYRSATAFIRVTPVNDPPVNSINANSDFSTAPALATLEDTPITLSTALGRTLTVNDLDIADVEGNDDLMVTLTAANGTLSAVTTGAAAITNNDSPVVTVRGSRAAINWALDGLVFTPDLHYNTRINLANPALITIMTDDLGNFGAGGQLTDTDTLTVTVNAVNDEPVNVVPPVGQTTNEDVAIVFATSTNNAFQFTDVDALEQDGDGVVQVDLTATNGVVNLSQLTNLVFTTGDGTGDAHMVFTGPVSDVNAALDGLSFLNDLNYNTATGLVDARGDATITFKTNDRGNVGLVGPLTDTDVATITIVQVNDDPVNAIPPAGQATNEDVAIVFATATANAFQFTDVDALEPNGDGIVSIQLVATNGALTLSGTIGLTFTVGDGVGDPAMTFEGPVAAVNAALDGLSFLNDLDYNTATGLTDARGDATITFTTNDRGNVGLGGPLGDTDAITITVAQVNDRPINVVPPVGQTTLEDTAIVFATGDGNAFRFTDVDVFEPTTTGLVQVDLTAANGVLSLSTINGLAFLTGDGLNDTVISFTGSVVDVNAALDGLTFLPDLNYNTATGLTDARGQATITMKSHDLGNVGIGGPLTDTDVVIITVNQVNDDPINVVPAAGQATNEDVAIVFSTAGGNAFQFTDVDALEPNGDGIVSIQLSAANGVLTLSGIAGLSFTLGDGMADAAMSFTGLVANVNAALNGLTFLNNLHYNTATGLGDGRGEATIAIVANDLGNVGVGGPLTDTDTITVTIAQVNDVPVNVVPPAGQTTNEDVALAFTTVAGNAFQFTDVDALEPNGDGIVQIDLTAVNGVLTLSRLTGLTFLAGDGTSDAGMSFKGAVVDVNAALNGLSFLNTLHYNTPAGLNFGAGQATIAMTSHDLGNVGLGGPLTDSDTITVTVNPVNDAPTQVIPPTQFVREDEILTFSPADGNVITFADVDVLETFPANGGTGAGVLDVTLTTTNGVVTLGGFTGLTFLTGDGVSDAVTRFRGVPNSLNAALNGLTFLGTLNYNGPATIVVTTSDLNNTGSGGVKTVTNTITVSIAAVNDPPINYLQGNANFPGYVASNPTRFTIPEDTSLTLSALNFNRITIDDSADNTTGSVRVTLTATNGTVTLPSIAGLVLPIPGQDGNADPTVTFEGPISTINARMNGLIFRPDNNFDGLAQLTITTNDRGLTGADGPQQDTDVIDIVVTPTNDAPSNLVPPTQTIAEDVPLPFNTGLGNAIRINDDAGALPVTVSLTVTNGNLTLGNTTGLISVSGNGSPGINLRGPLTTVNTVLQSLSFQGNLNFNGTALLVIATNDEGNSGGGAAQTDTDTVTITVTAVNDAPVNLFNNVTTFGTATTNDEDPVTFATANSNRITISDVDAGNGLMRVTLTGGQGVVSLGSRTGLTFTVGDGTADPTMTFTGTIVDVNAGLNNLIFRPDDYFSGTATLAILTSDQGQTGAGGILVDNDTVTITVVAVNDPPVNTAPGSQTTNEDTALVFSTANGNRITVADDAVTENQPISVTVAVRDTSVTPQPIGTLTLGPTVPGGLVVTSGASLINLVGLVADINTALAGLSFTPPLHFNGAVNLSVTTDDLGHSPFTVLSNVVSSSVAIAVNAVNDAPVNTIPAGPINMPEDTTLNFGAGQWATSDVDAGNGTIQVQLSSTLGAMSLGAGTLAGLTFVVGDGTADANLIFRGTIANLNAALSTLSYTPTTNLSGDAVLTMTTSDLGLTGSGGMLTDTDSLTVSIAPVNDPPTVTVPATQSVSEDGSLSFSTSNANAITVVDDAGANEILATINAANGAVTLVNTTGLASVTGNGSATIDVRGTLAAINNALNSLVLTPTSNFTGDALVTVTVNDQGNTGGGGNLSGSNSVTVTVLPRNDAPINTVPGTQTTPEDIVLVFGSGFGNQIAIDDIDAGVNPVRVQLAAVNGVLTLAGATGLSFTAGDGTDDGTMTFTGVMSAINTALNGLRFIPSTDFFGTGSVTITTNDQGNTGFPITSLQDSDTVTITISSVNDPPRTAPLPRATLEDVALTVAVASLMQNDVPGPNNESGQTLTFTGVDPTSANGGTVVVQGSNVIYTPPLNFPFASTVPMPDTFTYIVTDNGTTNGVSEPKSSRGTVTVTITPVNDAPVAGNDSFTMDEDTTLTRAAFNGVRANDTDAENSTLTVTRVSGPTAAGSTNGGTLSLGADGSFSYVPPANYFGTVTFTYRVNDGQLNSNIATATITVNNVNEPPVAVNDTATTTQGAAKIINVLANDTDSDGTLDPTTIVVVLNPAHGSAVANANGTITYTPSGSYQGPDVFQYTVRDNSGGTSNAAAVNVTIGAAPPQWQNQAIHEDINADTFVTPLDALILINDINNNGARLLQAPSTPLPPPFLDPDGNGQIESRDVLLVIEFINNDGSGEGEGDFSGVSTASSTFFVDVSGGFAGGSAGEATTANSPAVASTAVASTAVASSSGAARQPLVIPVHDLATAEGQRQAAAFRRQSAAATSLDSLVDELADEWTGTCPASATDSALESLFGE